MVGERSIRESELSCGVAIADQVDDPATIQRPESEVVNHHRYHRSRFDWSATRKQLDPTEVELPPIQQSFLSARKYFRAVAQRTPHFIYSKLWLRQAGYSNRPVRQWKLATLDQEIFNLGLRWPNAQKHWLLRPASVLAATIA
jgi:hypothetical protein